MHAIVARGLTKAYKSHLGKTLPPALKGLDLAVAENEVFGFLGRNGAGKTTTIKILCSLLRPTGGEALVMGKDVRTRAARRFIGYLPENPFFYEYLNPRETLAFHGRLHGLGAKDRAREWDRLSELLDLRGIATQRLRGFSKGMRQRVGFAVALAGDPRVLILDEPMSGLDPLGRRRIREVIVHMRDEGKTIFFSSHILGDVEQICDRVGILVEGKLTIEGPIRDLLARETNRVEVIAMNLTPGVIATIATRSTHMRESEAGHHFRVDDVGTANEIVEIIQSNGGLLVEFNPIRESLEDYFMRKQRSCEL